MEIGECETAYTHVQSTNVHEFTLQQAKNAGLHQHRSSTSWHGHILCASRVFLLSFDML